mgnify:CR=1 FL=1
MTVEYSVARKAASTAAKWAHWRVERSADMMVGYSALSLAASTAEYWAVNSVEN